MWRRRVVIDTGAGPNCVAKTALPPGASKILHSPPNIRLLGAGGKPLAIQGVVTLSVRVGRHIVNAQFLVCDTLQSTIFSIFSNKKTADGKPIEGKTPVAEPKSTPTSNKIRIARPATLGPRTQTWVTVVTKRRGTIIIEPRSSLATTHFVSATNGVETVKKDIPFRLLVANFGDRTVRLHKGQIIAHAMPHPLYTVQNEACLADVLSINLEEVPMEIGKLGNDTPKGISLQASNKILVCSRRTGNLCR
eukprot:IDg842t1